MAAEYCTGLRLITLQELEARRVHALARMRATCRDIVAFAAASREEATLSAQIRRHRRHRDGRDVPLTMEDQRILQRISERQEREYRIADKTDAEVLWNRLMFGSVVLAVARGIDPAVVR